MSIRQRFVSSMCRVLTSQLQKIIIINTTYKKQTEKLGLGWEEEKDLYLHPTHILPTSCSVNKVLRIAGSVVWTTPNLSSVNDAATK